MLVEIQCDKFAKEHQVIPFQAGLNTVLGSAGGSNAIGKSTFLWIVDYAFGGKDYYSMSSDIKKEVGAHTIYFTFQFEEEMHYFYRSTDDSQNVCRCDKDRHLIVKMPLDEYRAFLYQEYQINLPGLSFSDITERFFRIYGRENTQEKYPLLLRPRESDEKAVDFLLKLFGHCKIVSAIKNMEDELGIKAYQLKSRQHQLVDTEKIEMNEKTIESLKTRLQKLMENSEEAQMSVFG
ncbi:MAG: AAA family ATPase, partial [Ruthenibacterium sp.]